MDIKEAIIHARQVAEGCGVDGRDCAYQHDCLADWLEELVAYRALGTVEELTHGAALVKARDEGLVVVLPCRKGTKLFVITSDSPTGIEETKCSRVTVNSSGIVHIYARCVYDDWGGAYYEFKPTDFGKTVFLTRAEAEAALPGGAE